MNSHLQVFCVNKFFVSLGQKAEELFYCTHPQQSGDRCKWISEFEANLIYRLSSMPGLHEKLSHKNKNKYKK